jgi:hypothetical protein
MLDMIQRWAPELTSHVGRLLRSSNVESVASDPVDGLLFAFDVHGFMRAVEAAARRLAEMAGQPIRAAEISGFSINHEIYHALARLEMAAIIVEGASRVSNGRHPARLSRYGNGPLVAKRLQWLSNEFQYQLRAGQRDCSRVCDTVARIPGDAAVVSFPFGSLAFGCEAPGRGVEILATLARGCAERGIQNLTISTAAEASAARAANYPPPTLTATSGPAIEEMVGDGWTQRLLFGRMQQAYHISRLAGGHWADGTGKWLLQRTNLSLPELAVDPGRRPPTYWPAQWWISNPGYDATTHEVLALYDNFVGSASLDVRSETS